MKYIRVSIVKYKVKMDCYSSNFIVCVDWQVVDKSHDVTFIELPLQAPVFYPLPFCFSGGEDDAEDEESSEEELDSLCAVCSKSGTLVCCDNCPLSYHLGCAKPVLKKVPKGKWLCQVCAGTDTKSGKIKMNLIKGSY